MALASLSVAAPGACIYALFYVSLKAVSLTWWAGGSLRTLRGNVLLRAFLRRVRAVEEHEGG